MTKKQEERKKMMEFFLSIWKKRPHKSEISGKKIYGEVLSIYFHHILPKNKYDFAKYDPQNIAFITFEEHQKVENDIYFYPEINKRREKLMEKYNI